MSSEDSSNKNNDHPSLVGAHLKYVQGAASSALGYETGEETKKDAIQRMKQASAANHENSSGDGPTQSSLLGQVENKLGQITGCEGMEKEGAQRIPTGAEEQNGTG